MKNQLLRSVMLVLLFICTWFALLVQFYVSLQSGVVPVPELMIRYFSYFTIDTNLFAAISVTFLLFKSSGKVSAFFSSQSFQTATAAYIFIVGLIYNTVLRSLWSPQGIQMVLDELQHLINPLLFIAYWVLFGNQTKLPRSSSWYWLIFPLVYIFLVLVRGSFSGFYPYPFLNVTKLGFNSVLSNCVAITLLFVLAAVLFRAIGNYLAGRSQTTVTDK